MQAHLEVASAASTDEPFAETVDEIVAQLRDDPILVTQTMGNGATEEIDAALHAKLEQAQYPVYVVLTRTPRGVDGNAIDEDLTSLVHARLDEIGRGDGVYVVRTSEGTGNLAVYGDIDPGVDNDDTLLSLARYTALEEVRDGVEDAFGSDAANPAAAVEAGVVLDVAAGTSIPDHESSVLTPEQVADYTDATWVTLRYQYDDDPPEVVSPGLGAVVGVTVGLVVTVVAYRVLRALGPHRRASSPRRTPGVPRREQRVLVRAELVADARTEIDTLDRALVDDRSAAVPSDRIALAIGSRDTALGLLESDDPLDLVGARVLALTGSRALVLAGGRLPLYRPCYVDPRHGHARHAADLPGGLEVPVCRPCHRDLEAGHEPSALTERRRGRDRPYYAGDTVWARTGFGALTDELWRDVQRERTR